MTQKRCSILGVLFCGSALIFGAFGAHLLEKWLSTAALESFEVGVRYQFFHGLALLFLGLNKNAFLKRSATLFGVGVVLFSGSIYGLSLTSNAAVSLLPKILGPVTPIGGLLLISGWISMLVSYIRN